MKFPDGTSDQGFSQGLAWCVWIVFVAIPTALAAITGMAWFGNSTMGVNELAKNVTRAYVLAPKSAGPASAERAALATWNSSGCAVFNVCGPGSHANMGEIPPSKGGCELPRISRSGWGPGETVTVDVACEFRVATPFGELSRRFEARNVGVFESNRFPEASR